MGAEKLKLKSAYTVPSSTLFMLKELTEKSGIEKRGNITEINTMAATDEVKISEIMDNESMRWFLLKLKIF